MTEKCFDIWSDEPALVPHLIVVESGMTLPPQAADEGLHFVGLAGVVDDNRLEVRNFGAVRTDVPLDTVVVLGKKVSDLAVRRTLAEHLRARGYMQASIDGVR